MFGIRNSRRSTERMCTEHADLNRFKTTPCAMQPAAEKTRLDRPALREGDTRLCMMGPAGALFETDYCAGEGDQTRFTVLWFNADASGFMNEARGDRILSVRY